MFLYLSGVPKLRKINFFWEIVCLVFHNNKAFEFFVQQSESVCVDYEEIEINLSKQMKHNRYVMAKLYIEMGSLPPNFARLCTKHAGRTKKTLLTYRVRLNTCEVKQIGLRSQYLMVFRYSSLSTTIQTNIFFSIEKNQPPNYKLYSF